MDKMIDQMIETYDPDNKSHWHGLSEGYREGMMN
jgi:transcriptional regulator